MYRSYIFSMYVKRYESSSDVAFCYQIFLFSSWLTLKFWNQLFSTHILLLSKKMSETSCSNQPHKKRKYCVNDAVDFVSFIVISSFLFYLHQLTLVLVYCLITRLWNAVCLFQKHYAQQSILVPDSTSTKCVTTDRRRCWW